MDESTTHNIVLNGITIHGDRSGEPVPQLTLTADTLIHIPEGQALELISTAPITEIRWRRTNGKEISGPQT